MADINQKIYPTINLPVGSREEVEAIDPKLLLSVATCSARIKDTNFGCHRHDDCTLPWKDGRAQNGGWRFHNGNGTFRDTACHCQIAEDRRIAIEANGGWVEHLASEGEEIGLRGTVRRHVIKDPACPACARGDCISHKDVVTPHTIPALPPAVEHPDLAGFLRVSEVKKRRRDFDQSRKRAESYGFTNEPPPRKEPADEAPNPERGPVAGSGQGRGGSRQNPKAAPDPA